MAHDDEALVQLARRLADQSVEQSNQMIGLQLLVAFVIVEISRVKADPAAFLEDVSARLSGLAEMAAANMSSTNSVPEYSPAEIARTIDRVSVIVSAAQLTR